MGKNRNPARVAAHAQRKPPRRHKQQQSQQCSDRHVQPNALAAGANWKNASSLKHNRQESSKLGKRKVAKKVSSKPRDGKHIHVAVASPGKKQHNGYKHHSHAFPRGKHQDAEALSAHIPERRMKTKLVLGARLVLEGTQTSSSTSEETLDDEIEAFVRLVSLTPKERAFRLRVFREMKELICATFQDATVQLYGSSSNGLDTFRSDLDITVGNITLSNSLRSDVHSTMGIEADELDGDPESDEEDYEDERYQAPQALSSSTVRHSIECSNREETDEEPSFSLNIAMPASLSSTNGGGYSSQLPLAKSPWNPTLRRKKIRVLRALQYLLKVKRPQLQVKCLQKAKIPILMVLDPESQLNIDIGVNREAFESSDHGRTTSLVIELQQVLGRAFTVLVTFLKEFLHQFELDKPFTGGIGSFRLYIMVASLFPLEKSKSKTGGCKVYKRVPPVSTLLLTFFQVFGNKKKPNYLQSSTVLRLPFEDSAVDFATVFRVSDCVDAFAMAYDILVKTNSIGSIIFEDRLADEREQVRKAMMLATQAGQNARQSRNSTRNTRR